MKIITCTVNKYCRLFVLRKSQIDAAAVANTPTISTLFNLSFLNIPDHPRVFRLRRGRLKPNFEFPTSPQIIREYFGSDVVASRPTSKVREAETVMLVEMVRQVSELALLSRSPELFEQVMRHAKKH
jgi:hypothetical protein